MDSGVERRLLEVVRRSWGFEGFRPDQREAMGAIVAGRDSIVVLPTGGGKSLCYQAPAVALEALAVVVSPLISLMKDQVDALSANGVPAAFYNSTLGPVERREVIARLRSGRVRLLYVSPERLAGEGSGPFLELLRSLGPRFVAVDEAHCISHWGHDFRPEYRRLGVLREVLPEVSLHAFTATATPRVRDDIVRQLGLRDPAIVIGTFDRPNLTYRVRRRTNLLAQLRAVLDAHRGEGGIVYCLARRDVDNLSARLAELGYSVAPYHAGLSDEERKHHQEEFVNERVDVVVATVAFGMGIDRSNVRFVLHAAAPRSVEHYQQETGRAGRDGLPAECVLFYSPADFAVWRGLLERGDEATPEALELLGHMWRYAAQVRCRHKALSEYFGQEHPGGCGACDVCLGELERVEDATVLAQKILSCVVRTGQRWGAAQVADVLRGANTEKVRNAGHDRLSTYGLLAQMPMPELRGHLDQLIDLGLLAQDGGKFPVLKVTAAGWEVLRSQRECELWRQPAPPKRSAKRAASRKPKRDDASWEGVDQELFDRLRELRRRLAEARKVPPYVIFHDRTLRDMARLKPVTPGQLLEVYGVGEKKAAELGPPFLEVIAAHAESSS
ncbi:MAG TPA: DNA helicase RecQ [Acidobacteria bacterium]|nr:DNA helicase RecQ [Acidobacteriota bacterium]